MKKRIFTTLLLLTLILPLFAFDGFTDIFGSQQIEEPTLSTPKKGMDIGGTVSFNIEGIQAGSAIQTAVQGGLTLDLRWTGSIVDAKTSLELLPRPDDDDTLHWLDIFTHLSIITYFEGGRVEAGLLKKEWGSADGVHVVDVLNSPDYRNGIVDDPLKMKISEPMIMTTASYNNYTIDIVYKPMLIPMVAASKETDRWLMPFPALPVADFPGFKPETTKVTIIPPTILDLATLSHSQFGSRVKGTIGAADIGLIYWNGYYPSPGVGEIETIFVDPTVDPDNLELKEINAKLTYTRAQLFGGEATVVSGPLTLMVEGGFWLSQDNDGSDPFVYNNKLVYLAGLGWMIPKTSAYANLTYSGQYIMDFDKNAVFDVDTLQASISSDGKPYMNTLTAALELPFAKEKVKLRVAGTYQLETKGYAILPSLSWNIQDDLVVKAAGRFFGSASGGSQSLFKNWENNDSLTVGISYIF